jgi:hypothetical protein
MFVRFSAGSKVANTRYFLMIKPPELPIPVSAREITMLLLGWKLL